jgi:dCMP deaminase
MENDYHVIENSDDLQEAMILRYRKPESALRVWLGIAQQIATRSSAPDKQVGVVAIDKRGNIIAYGYNHNVDSNDPSTVDCDGRTRDSTLHAEDELIQRASESGRSLEGATLYITHSPCERCAARLIRAKVNKIYYLEEFKNGISHDMLMEHGVDMFQVVGVSSEVDQKIKEAEDLEDHLDSLK